MYFFKIKSKAIAFF